MEYGQIIEYVDGTFDEKFNEAKAWCNANKATLNEIIERRENGKRYFQINKIPEPKPVPVVEKVLTIEDIRLIRAEAYAIAVDPLTAHIQRLRDEEQTEEIKAEIEALLAERKARVAQIKEQNPYPVE
jgi:hypothetical protein